MKQYWLFLFNSHYPGGGMNDFYGAFHSVEDAARFVRTLKDCPEHYQIVDVLTSDEPVKDGATYWLVREPEATP